MVPIVIQLEFVPAAVASSFVTSMIAVAAAAAISWKVEPGEALKIALPVAGALVVRAVPDTGIRYPKPLHTWTSFMVSAPFEQAQPASSSLQATPTLARPSTSLEALACRPLPAHVAPCALHCELVYPS